jgi:hypothetical protein
LRQKPFITTQNGAWARYRLQSPASHYLKQRQKSLSQQHRSANVKKRDPGFGLARPLQNPGYALNAIPS